MISVEKKNMLWMILDEYTSKVEGEMVTKPLSELFKAFSYDKATKVYTAELTWYGTTGTARIIFNNGKIRKMELEDTVTSEGTVATTQTDFVRQVYSYGGGNIVIPQEVKNAHSFYPNDDFRSTLQ